MKNKLTSHNREQIENNPTPAQAPEAGQNDVIPPGLEYFTQLKNKTHTQQLATVLPKFADALARGDIEYIEGTASVFYGLGIDLGVTMPEWVKAASRKFWEGMGFEFVSIFKGDASQIGKLVGLIDHVPRNENPSESDQAFQTLAQLAKIEAANLPANEHLEFAKGRVEAPKIIEKWSQPNQRTIIYGIIAAGRREVEKFESTEDLYLWLMTLRNLDAAAEYTLARKTKSREIRKICNRIGLKFSNQWTRPRAESEIQATLEMAKPGH